MSATKETQADWGLLVKDIVVLSSRQGSDWWLMFRHRFEAAGRVTPIPGTGTPQGDHVWVCCGDPDDGADSQEEAGQLREQMLSQGLPKTAVTVCRRPKSIGGAR